MNRADIITCTLHFCFSFTLPFQTTYHAKRAYDYKIKKNGSAILGAAKKLLWFAHFERHLVLNGLVQERQWCSSQICISTLSEIRNGTLPKLATVELWQATIMARDVVGTFSKSHYFIGKLNFPMVRPKELNIKMKIAPIYPHFQNRQKHFVPY